MKFNTKSKHFKRRRPIRRLVAGRIARLEKRAKAFSLDVVFSRIMVEENPARTLYHASITIEVPGKTLATKEESHDPAVAIKDAFTEIERQLKEYKSRLRGEHLWKRLGKRE